MTHQPPGIPRETQPIPPFVGHRLPVPIMSIKSNASLNRSHSMMSLGEATGVRAVINNQTCVKSMPVSGQFRPANLISSPRKITPSVGSSIITFNKTPQSFTVPKLQTTKPLPIGSVLRHPHVNHISFQPAGATLPVSHVTKPFMPIHHMSTPSNDQTGFQQFNVASTVIYSTDQGKIQSPHRVASAATILTAAPPGMVTAMPQCMLSSNPTVVSTSTLTTMMKKPVQQKIVFSQPKVASSPKVVTVNTAFTSKPQQIPIGRVQPFHVSQPKVIPTVSVVTPSTITVSPVSVVRVSATLSSVEPSKPTPIISVPHPNTKLSASFTGQQSISQRIIQPMAGAVFVTVSQTLPMTNCTVTTAALPVSQVVSSPKPTILLRKRPSDSTPKKVSQPVFDSAPISAVTSISTSRSPTLSNSSSETSSASETPCGTPIPSSSASLELISEAVEISKKRYPPNSEPFLSPRKKPRKQLVVTHEDRQNEIVEVQANCEATKVSDDSDTVPDIIDEDDNQNSAYVDGNGLRWVNYNKRYYLTLMSGYKSYMPTHNHFEKYAHIRIREEKRPTATETANQRGVQAKANGWKVAHCASQLDMLRDDESTIVETLENCLKDVAGEDSLSELIKGNLHRSKLSLEQLTEAKSSLLGVLDHSPKVIQLLKQHGSKRASRKASHFYY